MLVTPQSDLASQDEDVVIDVCEASTEAGCGGVVVFPVKISVVVVY